MAMLVYQRVPESIEQCNIAVLKQRKRLENSEQSTAEWACLEEGASGLGSKLLALLAPQNGRFSLDWFGLVLDNLDTTATLSDGTFIVDSPPGLFRHVTPSTATSDALSCVTTLVGEVSRLFLSLQKMVEHVAAAVVSVPFSFVVSSMVVGHIPPPVLVLLLLLPVLLFLLLLLLLSIATF